MRVLPRVPTHATAIPLDRPPSLRRLGMTLLGCAYLVLSMTLCVWYPALLNPHFANDIWWAKYSPSTHQALVVDLFNAWLTTHSNGSLDLLAPRATMDKTYATSVATTKVYPTYVRRVLLTELTSIEFAIDNLRSLSAYWAGYMCTQYCWVDLNHRFEVAHTVGRQKRCESRYRANGAVYLETVLRNQVWDEFISTYGGDGGSFTIVIQNWLEQVPEGQNWLATTSTARELTTVDQEKEYWRANHIDYFQLQWQNHAQTGISESIVIQNALNRQLTIQLKSVARSREPWTSVVLYWLLANDLGFLASLNRSLIRSANNSITQPPSINIEDAFGLQDSNGDYVAQAELFRTSVGPFLSVDTFYIGIPSTVLAFYDGFQTALYSTLVQNPKFQFSFDSIPSLTVATIPPSWQKPNFVYYGGSPMCLTGDPVPYVQQTFGFYDICDTQPPLTATVTKYSGTFSTIAMTLQLEQTSPCIPQTLLPQCTLNLNTFLAVATDLVALASFDASLIPPAVFAIENLKVSIMQFASLQDETNWTLLTQPLLADSRWAFYGWNFIYDWIQGMREVVSFEGDVTSQVLMSVADPPLLLSSSNSVTSATRLMYILVLYVTAVLFSLAAICTFGIVLLRFQVEGTHLVWFNRIVGSVWVGRPLMLIRGITATLILSTTQLELANISLGQRSHFEFVPRPWLATLVIGSEATWVLYVVHDFLSILTNRFTIVYSPLSCVFGWLLVVTFEILMPLQPIASTDRTCIAKDMDSAVQCTSGSLQIGNWERVLIIYSILCISIGLAVLCGVSYRRRVHHTIDDPIRHVLGIADMYFQPPRCRERNDNLVLDNISCLMAGLVPIFHRKKQSTFDVKLWIIREDQQVPIHEPSKIFTFRAVRVQGCYNSPTAEILSPTTVFHRLKKKVIAFCGILYATSAIIGSVSYLQVSRVNLANDLFWATFNVTAAHTFIAKWMNEQLVLGVSLSDPFRFNIESINQDESFATANTAVQSSANFGAIMQYSELNILESTIVGLRQTDACTTPWIFTQYCFVDFEQKWELANTMTRQKRCQGMVSNGAVFLESILRNIPFDAFYSCWGSSFDQTIASELRQSLTGRLWLEGVALNPKASIPVEVAMWQASNISSFDTQWQNFKSIGLVNSYSVENALGTTYDFTLQYSNSTFRVAQQTTYKMYWGLANDFFAIAHNSSGIGGHSLIRSSPVYAFANATMQSMLFQNGTLHSPLGNAFTIIYNVIGPFGSVDMRFVPCPKQAQDAVRVIFKVLREVLFENNTAQVAFNQIDDPRSDINPAPKTWTDINFFTVGGSPLCPEVAITGSAPISFGMLTLLSWQTQCSSAYPWTFVNPTRNYVVTSVILANMSFASADGIGRTCAQNFKYIDVCMEFLSQTVTFVGTYMAHKLNSLTTLTSAATTAVQALNVEFLQFGQQDPTSPVILYRINVLDPTETDFAYFAWNFLIDWTLGQREAVSFEGDIGSTILLTELFPALLDQVNLGENPTNMAFYLRNTVEYITGLMIVVAALVVVYIFVSFGHVEVINLLEIQRVGAIIWVGRPLLFVRSLTGIALLSTCSLELVFNGYISYFVVVQDPWYKTMLAANEVTWMVAIVNDIAMAFTQEYTTQCAYVNSILVWIVSVVLSFVDPINHSMSINKQCTLVQVDAQVVCTSGTIKIGHFSRLTTIIGIVFGCNAICYVNARLFFARPPRSKINSIFVYSGARYLFTTANWIHDDIYYMDRMSAALNGILTLRLKNMMYALDVKLWRTFRVDLSDEFPLSPRTQEFDAIALSALPLTISL
ncbi:Aste57867_14097 [Aphanomyces stellatus]|uniref:Aste57867_14097 protein n=1 Tax=Aphanomyces stellatus TaxID=120398 RepID=A0A485L0P3_9STRA|nr:hypothetical protein As57867_014046 [Aphanomyces stellatus]VFT90925.1 Aste57867_14097 [Aphanomyces stellatus]